MSLETDPNTKDTDQIGMVMLYQADSTEYINISKEFKQNSTNHIQLCSSYAINSYKTWLRQMYVLKRKHKTTQLRY